MPDDVTFTGIRGRFTTTAVPLALVGTTIAIDARLFHGAESSTTPTPTPLQCTAAPSLTGIIAPGTLVVFSCTGASVPFAAGDVGYVELSATATGVSLINVVQGQAAISLATT